MIQLTVLNSITNGSMSFTLDLLLESEVHSYIFRRAFSHFSNISFQRYGSIRILGNTSSGRATYSSIIARMLAWWLKCWWRCITFHSRGHRLLPYMVAGDWFDWYFKLNRFISTLNKQMIFEIIPTSYYSKNQRTV